MSALIVVDFQNDFCPPSGSLAVPDGRTITRAINVLLTHPFALKLATRDFHPPNHISFATTTPPFTSSTTITHTDSRSYTTTLWPVHCVQGTPGVELVSDLDLSKVDEVIDKGMRQDREMYSAFYDPFKESDSGLNDKLKQKGIKNVFVVGLAADYCVKATAEHALQEGYRTYIVEDATKPVFPDKWDATRQELENTGIIFVKSDGPEIAKIAS